MSWEVAKAAVDDFLSHCALSEKSAPLDEPPVTYAQVVEQYRLLARPVRRVSIGFYGGEPLLNFPVVRRCTEYVLERTGGKDIGFHISTNGYLLRGEVADFLGRNRFHVRVSLDGPPAIHDRQRRTVEGSPTWTVVMANIREFRAKYPERGASLGAILEATLDVDAALKSLATAPWMAPHQRITVAIASEPYPGYYKAAAGTGEDAGATHVFRAYMENLVKGRLNLVLDDRELWLQQSMFSRTFKSLHTDRWRCAAARRDSHPMMPNGPCIPGLQKVFVSVDGEYSICEKANCRGYELGNVRSGVDYDKAFRILDEFVHYTREQCACCWCLPICSVGCYVAVAGIRGGKAKGTKAMKEQACARCREYIHEKIVEYCSILEKNPAAFDFYEL